MGRPGHAKKLRNNLIPPGGQKNAKSDREIFLQDPIKKWSESWAKFGPGFEPWIPGQKSNSVTICFVVCGVIVLTA